MKTPTVFNRLEAAQYLGISSATLASWASIGRPNIPFYKLGRKCVYRKSDLDAYMDRHRVDGPARTFRYKEGR